MKALLIAIALSPVTGLLANGPTLQLDDTLNESQELAPQMQEEEVSLDRETIKTVQKELTARGFYTGTVDGIIGPQTERAIRKFQAARGMTDTGKLNNDTLTALTGPGENTENITDRNKEIQAQESTEQDRDSQKHKTH